MSYLKVIGVFVQTERVYGRTGHLAAIRIALVYRVGMYRDKQIATVTVRYIGPLLQGYEVVVVACHHNLYVRHLLTDHGSQFLGNAQVYVLFTHVVVDRSCIVTAMPGIYHDCKLRLLRSSPTRSIGHTAAYCDSG